MEKFTIGNYVIHVIEKKLRKIYMKRVDGKWRDTNKNLRVKNAGSFQQYLTNLLFLV
tara:strand:+ start:497 stop:667 length:171 start_codon:yes stop_codon:yes gene_type:complete